MSDSIFGLERNHKIPDGEEVALLTTVRDVVMLGMVRGLLEDADIPYLVKERATDSAMRIMTGFSLFGTDIFVPVASLETARELISGFESGEDEDRCDSCDSCGSSDSDSSGHDHGEVEP